MGGCFSKNNQDTHKIQYNMEWVDHTRTNSMFEEAQSILSNIEKLRAGIEDSSNNAMNISNVSHLKEPSFHEAIRVLFWAISANNQGEFHKAGFDVQAYPPFVSIKDSGLWIQTAELNDCLTTYITTIVEGPEIILKLIPKLDRLIEDLDRAISDMKNEAGANMSTIKASIAAGKNLNRIREQLPKVKRTKELVEEAVKDIPNLMEKLLQYVKDADGIGGQAYKDNLYWPREIFDKFHTGPKKTPEEIAAMNKKK